MTANWRMILIAAAVCATAATVPASVSAAADLGAAPILGYDLAAFSTTQAPALAAQTPDQAPATDAQAAIDADSLECMAKVVHHESRGQPRRGMIAVAQTLVHRVKAGGRFGNSICAVANQRGQFFNTAAYHPRQDADWQQAVDVSRDALRGTAEEAAPGALFFHAAYRANSGFFHGRERIAAIGGQVFYR